MIHVYIDAAIASGHNKLPMDITAVVSFSDLPPEMRTSPREQTRGGTLSTYVSNIRGRRCGP